MRFADIKGNEDVKRSLRNMADSGRVAHAMLFYENDGCGALALALAYTQYLNCPHRHDGDSCGECPSCNKISKMIHSDVHFVFPTNAGSKCSMKAKDITSEVYMKEWRNLALENPYFLESELMDEMGLEAKSWDVNVLQAKKIIEELSFSSVENAWKTVIFYLPEKMNAEAANKLLKIVEEPPEKTLFLFITHNPDKVLQTIFSRCQSSRVVPLSREEVREYLVEKAGAAPEEAAAQASVCAGSIGEALHNMGEKGDRKYFLDLFFDLMNAVMARDLLSALTVGEQMADLGSREKQKALCAFMTESMRKVFLLKCSMPEIALVPEQEKLFYEKLAASCGPEFPKAVTDILGRMSYMIDRNVSQKMLFCDFVCRIFMNFKK